MDSKNNSFLKNRFQENKTVLYQAENRLVPKMLRGSPLFYLNWCYLRPFLKKAFPLSLHQRVRHIRARFQPSFYQYAPLPLQVAQNDQPILMPVKESLPLVSIVTPSLNQAAFLERTIKSVIGQHYPKLEYFIMDGASKDGTDRILSDYEERVSYIESRRDSGQANAINRGFQQSSGEIMAWLNSDDLLLPGAIASVVNFFEEHPEVDVVYGHRISVDEHNNEVGRWILPPHDDTVLAWANYVPQETLFWRRRLWEKVGGELDESYQFIMDWDLLLRFQQAGASFIRLPMFLGAFRVHAEQKTSRLADTGEREAARLHRKYHGRDIEWLEVRHRVRHYLARCMLRYLLYDLKLYKID